MRCFHVGSDSFAAIDGLPQALPGSGYLWIGCTRAEFEANAEALQGVLSSWTGGPLVDLHVSDLLNPQLPSNFDTTSWYELLVFRRLAAGAGSEALLADDAQPSLASIKRVLDNIDTNPVGFAVFDRVLLSVHPADCQVREHFATRLAQMTQGAERRGNSPRLPASPADLMLRIVNHMVDSYLALRRLLTRQLGFLQQTLLSRSSFSDWPLLLASRIALHTLEDTCEDQRSAIQEWIDALDEWPAETDAARRRERELLRLRSRDVLEHVERVLGHVRRLESSAETAVQMHFSLQGSRTNEIMRTLTVLTAIFLPLNLVTGFFGMNFEGLPLIHSARGFWLVAGLMLLLGVGLTSFFWRKRYLRRNT